MATGQVDWLFPCQDKDRCCFFQWIDGPERRDYEFLYNCHDAKPASPENFTRWERPPGYVPFLDRPELRVGVRGANQSEFRRTLSNINKSKEEPPPGPPESPEVCEHGLEAVVDTCHGDLADRTFYRCPLPEDEWCGYFNWVDPETYHPHLRQPAWDNWGEQPSPWCHYRPEKPDPEYAYGVMQPPKRAYCIDCRARFRLSKHKPNTHLLHHIVECEPKQSRRLRMSPTTANTAEAQEGSSSRRRRDKGKQLAEVRTTQQILDALRGPSGNPGGINIGDAGNRDDMPIWEGRNPHKEQPKFKSYTPETYGIGHPIDDSWEHCGTPWSSFIVGIERCPRTNSKIRTGQVICRKCMTSFWLYPDRRNDHLFHHDEQCFR